VFLCRGDYQSPVTEILLQIINRPQNTVTRTAKRGQQTAHVLGERRAKTRTLPGTTKKKPSKKHEKNMEKRQ